MSVGELYHDFLITLFRKVQAERPKLHEEDCLSLLVQAMNSDLKEVDVDKVKEYNPKSTKGADVVPTDDSVPIYHASRGRGYEIDHVFDQIVSLEAFHFSAVRKSREGNSQVLDVPSPNYSLGSLDCLLSSWGQNAERSMH
eukprot:IDg16136t1